MGFIVSTIGIMAVVVIVFIVIGTLIQPSEAERKKLERRMQNEEEDT